MATDGATAETLPVVRSPESLRLELHADRSRRDAHLSRDLIDIAATDPQGSCQRFDLGLLGCLLFACAPCREGFARRRHRDVDVGNPSIRGKDEGAFEDVLHLSNVARPGIGQGFEPRGLNQCLFGSGIALGELADDVRDQASMSSGRSRSGGIAIGTTLSR